MISFLAPTAPPDSFSIVSINARNATLSWTLPEESERNGMITTYMVACTDGDSVMTNTLTTSNFTATIEGLSPFSFYMCNVTASTRVGSGPAASLNFTTDADSK